MKPNDERERELSSEDVRLIRAIDAGLRPAPMDPARRAAFRAAIEARIERGAHPWRWLAPVGAALAATAVTLWLVRPVAVVPAETETADASLYAFIGVEAVSAELTEQSTYLPDDYRALALMIEPDEDAP